MLDRKLLRDLGTMKGQVLTIALVVASGITSFVCLQSTWDSLEVSRETYYTRYRFGDVFVHLKRAPDPVHDRLAAIPGVARAYTRVVETVRLPLEGARQPPIGEIVTLPAGGDAPLNAVLVRRGRMPEPGRSGEALLLTAFARRYGIEPGDTLPAVINGVRRVLRIVGLADSPEFVYAIPPAGEITDDRRFAVLWMDRESVAPAFQLDGAFNDAVLALQPGASAAAVRAAADRVLDPYGGLGAVSRERQVSHYTLTGELDQLRSFATWVPLIFLGVSAFLVNVVLSRLVILQRGQIASLKAIGYANAQIGLHFLKLVALLVLIGTVLGTVFGAWLGRELTQVYADVFHFPLLVYRLGPQVVGIAALVSLASAAAGALGSVRRVVTLPPAEAMRPPAPAVYRPMLVDRLGLSELVGQSWRIVLRELEHRPLRTGLSALGIAAAVGILVVGRFQRDAVNWLVDVQMERAMREDLRVDFIRALPERAVRELAHLPGVRQVDALRAVPVRLSMGPRYRDVPVFGYPDDIALRRIVTTTGVPVTLPADGMVLSRALATVLGARPGDEVELELLEGDRGRRRVAVAGLIDDMTGIQGYMRLDRLDRLTGDVPVVSAAFLTLDPAMRAVVERRLDGMPLVAAVSSRRSAIDHIWAQVGKTMMVMSLVLTLFAATIAVGVVYNNARVALSMRSRDLASLRVLGFTRGEISRILLGELGLQLVVALPVGWVFGYWLTALVISTIHAELYRFPVTISSRTYAIATLTVVAAGLVSALLVRRQLDRLDLVAVLKTRE
jgi:putative ABC transport system permease protein